MVNKMQRSRLRLTIVGIVVMLLALVPILRVIEIKMQNSVFELAAEISGYVGILSVIGLIISYYTNKETQRPSLQNNTYVNIDDEDNEAGPIEDL